MGIPEAIDWARHTLTNWLGVSAAVQLDQRQLCCAVCTREPCTNCKAQHLPPTQLQVNCAGGQQHHAKWCKDDE